MTYENVRPQQRLLEAHRTLLRAGLALVSAFAWIFVFQFAFSFSGNIAGAVDATLLAYAFSQATLIIATPISAAHLRRGVKRSMLFGVLLAALAFATLGATLAGYFSSPLGFGLVLFGVLFGAYRALYWIPYRLQRAGSQDQQSALFDLLLALLPAFAGATLASVALSSIRLLFGAALLAVLSALPLLFLRDTSESFEWGYFETFGRLFDQRHRTLALRATLSGIESATLFLIWPIAVFLIVGRLYLVLGFVMSASLLVVLVVRSVYRGLLRSTFPNGSLALETAFSTSSWVLRLAAGSPLMIVFADSYSFASAPAGAPEFVSREHAADGGSYVDEYTALQEIGLGFGRIIMCAFAGLLLMTAPLSVALALCLIVAAFAAGSATILSRKVRVEAY